MSLSSRRPASPNLLALRRQLAPNVSVDPDDVPPAKRALGSLGYYDAPEQGITRYPDHALFEGTKRYQKDRSLRVDGVIKPGGETESRLNRDLAALERRMRAAMPGEGSGSGGTRGSRQGRAGASSSAPHGKGQPAVRPAQTNARRPSQVAAAAPTPAPRASASLVAERPGTGLGLPPYITPIVPDRATPRTPVFGLGRTVGGMDRLRADGSGGNQAADIVALKRGLAWAGFYPAELAQTPDPAPEQALFEALTRFQRAHGLTVDGYARPGGETERALDATIAPRIQQVQAAARQEDGTNEGAAAQSPREESAREESAREDRRERWREVRDTERLDAIEGELRQRAEDWRAAGRPRAADFLDRFLDGDGETVVLSREEVRASPFVRAAEERNNRRVVERTFLGDTGSPDFNERVRRIEDGAPPITLTDTWDYERSSSESLLRGGVRAAEELAGADRSEELDDVLAFGANKVASDVEFEMRREGDTIYVEGRITHKLKDLYDFGRFGPGEWVGARDLQEAGRGTPFPVEGEWTQSVKGTVRIVGTNDDDLHVLGDPTFEILDEAE